MTLARYENASLWAWPPKETARVEGWLLRAGGGGSRRINSARTLFFEKQGEVARAIHRVEDWYRKRGLPPCFAITDQVAPCDLDRCLEAAGYGLRTPTRVLTRPVGAHGPSLPHAVELVGRPRNMVLDVLAERHWDTRLRAGRAAIYERIRRPWTFGLCFAGNEPVAVGCCVVVGEIAVLHSFRTVPAARGRGFAFSVLMRLLEWAAGMGAREAMLQVEKTNLAAASLYERTGFRPCYHYHYRQKD